MKDFEYRTDLDEKLEFDPDKAEANDSEVKEVVGQDKKRRKKDKKEKVTKEKATKERTIKQETVKENKVDKRAEKKVEKQRLKDEELRRKAEQLRLKEDEARRKAEEKAKKKAAKSKNSKDNQQVQRQSAPMNDQQVQRQSAPMNGLQVQRQSVSMNNQQVQGQNTNNKGKQIKKYNEGAAEKRLRKKKNKDRAVIIGSVICLILVLVGAIFTLFVSEYEEKKKFEREKKVAQAEAIEKSSVALEKYYQCINAGDYTKLYTAIDNATKAKRAEDNFIFVNKAFYNEINMTGIKAKVKSCKLPSDEEKEGLEEQASDSVPNDKYGASKTVIDYTVTVNTDSSEFSFDYTANMIKEDDSWHVVWNSGLIYPDYQPLDKVTTTYASTLRGTIFDRNNKELATVKDNARYYPYADAAAHLVGFVSRITSEELQERKDNGDNSYGSNSIIGKKGLEYAFESVVKGKGGQKITLSDSNGNEKKVIVDSQPIKGDDLKVTIDAEMQKILYEEIKNENAFSVAMNPYTGEILAMVSTPSYDNNGVVKGTASDTYNRFARSYSPGSTFKPLTGAVGLDCGAFTADTSFGVSSMRWQNDSSWGDLYVTTTHASNGKLNNAITVSDNVYFAKAALRIGGSNMRNGLDKIGFNQQLPIEMNFNKSQYSNTETFTSEAMLANSGYGQGQILVNPLHMASVYSAFVNEGNMIKPVFRYNGTPEFWIKNAFKKETASTILEALENVVQSGTATRLRSSSLKVAGKTGTAEIKASQDDRNGTELGWFVAITPEEEKENAIVLVTMVENVKNRGGSSFVVSKTRNMLKKIYSKY